MPKRGQIIVAASTVGRPQDRAAHLAMYARQDAARPGIYIAFNWDIDLTTHLALYSEDKLVLPYTPYDVEGAIIRQQTTKRVARAVSGADQRSRTEAKSAAARERRDSRGQAPAKVSGQMLLPID